MNRILLIVFAVLVGGALVVGYVATGGLTQGQMERRDKERTSHLRDIARYVQCADKAEALPETVPQEGYCGNRMAPENLNDPLTGELYAYRRIDADRFEVCATFEADLTLEKAAWPFRELNFDDRTGCLRRIRQATGGWELY